MIVAVDRAELSTLVEFAEDARRRMRAADESATGDIERRYGELRSGMDRGLATGEADASFALATALVPFWIATKRIDDADAWFDAALEQPAITDARRARALYDHGYLVFWAGRYELAKQRFEEAIEAATAVADWNVVALALAGSARVALNDDPAEAVRLLRRAFDVTEELPTSEGRSSADHVIGVALQMSGDLEGARGVMEQRLRRAREGGNEFVVSVESGNLSMVERQLGNLERAEALSKDAIRIMHRLGDEMAVAWLINGLAAVTAAAGAHARAAALLGLAESLLERAGGEWPPDERVQHDDTLATLAAALPADALDRARADASTMEIDQAVAFALSD
jgi:tetratricopeptide (TPR) repeat protein